MNQYQPRLEKLFDWMARESVTLAVFEDAGGRRDQTVRYLTGQPGDALLFLSLDRKTVLVPWDINMAKAYAHADMIIPYSEFERLPHKAITAVAEMLGIPAGSKIEIPPVTPYPLFLNYVGELTDFDILCRERGLAAEVKKIRAVKDDEEIKIYRKAADITNALIGLLEKNTRSGKIKTEADAALLIEVEARRGGCEGTGFETLAAGPERSFGIHAYPAWTDSPFAGPGLSILDFGVRLAGYTTDVTLTFVREANSRQEKLAGLVEKAAKLSLSMADNGAPARGIASAVEDLFAKAKKRMPHALGHGIGLEEHEYPAVSKRPDNEWILEPGMIFTLEPGLYDPLHGGCRLENDILMTETGPEVLTEARIIRL
ncbi:MAG: Xaa-Pro peptidase family protein [Treponema sp.]|jgi:Xaa-Pro dipeptidase|nr:Xaa-Pro peptidase family protein [Treponema sp.]